MHAREAFRQVEVAFRRECLTETRAANHLRGLLAIQGFPPSFELSYRIHLVPPVF